MRYFLKKALIFIVITGFLNYLLIFHTSLNTGAIKSLNVFFLAVFLWTTELIHPTLTGLLIFCLIPALGVLSSEETFGVMGDTIIWRLLGIFILTKGNYCGRTTGDGQYDRGSGHLVTSLHLFIPSTGY